MVRAQAKYDNSTVEGRSKNRRVELAIVANEELKERSRKKGRQLIFRYDNLKTRFCRVFLYPKIKVKTSRGLSLLAEALQD